MGGKVVISHEVLTETLRAWMDVSESYSWEEGFG